MTLTVYFVGGGRLPWFRYITERGVRCRPAAARTGQRGQVGVIVCPYFVSTVTICTVLAAFLPPIVPFRTAMLRPRRLLGASRCRDLNPFAFIASFIANGLYTAQLTTAVQGFIWKL